MAYKHMQKLNKELQEKGYLTIQGRIEESYLYERFSTPKEKWKGGMNGEE